MVREANRGAVIPTAGGERGLGQGWVCGGQIPPPFQFSDSNTDDWDNRPYLWESLRLKVKRRKRTGPEVGVRGPNPTDFSILRLEHGRLGQSSLPVGKLEAKS